MHPCNGALDHPAGADLLQYATEGCLVDCGQNWTITEMQAAIKNGAHKSAWSKQAQTALRREALEQVADKCMRIVKWNDIKHDPPENLKISPITAIPHKSRDYQMILDLAFSLQLENRKLMSVNNSSNKNLAPHHAMYELGNVIPQIIHKMAVAPETGVPILFSKIDLKDGYWQMVANEKDAWNFAYVLPLENANDDVELVIPDALQMGWSESPRFFCSATKTAQDLPQKYFTEDIPCTPHKDEHIILDINWKNIPKGNRNKDLAFLHLLEVYIDDFIALIQSTDEEEITRLTRCILQGITDIFPPPDLTGGSIEAPISCKKLIEDGIWATRKGILGWVLDGIAQTIELPTEKCDKLISELQGVQRAKVITVKRLQQLQGKLMFASIGIPLGKPLLGTMDQIMAGAIARNKLSLNITDKLQSYCCTWSGIVHLMQ